MLVSSASHDRAARARRRAESIMVIVAASMPLQATLRGGLGQVTLALADLAIGFALVVSLPYLRIRTTAWSPWHVAMAALIPTWAVVTAMVASVSDAALVVKALGYVWLFLGYALATWALKDAQGVRRIARAYATSVSVVNAVVLLLWLGGGSMRELVVDGRRLVGFANDPTAYGAMIVVGVALLAPHIDDRAFAPSKSLAILQIALMLVGLTLTSSRSAWVAVGLVVVLLVAKAPRQGATVIALIVAGIIATTLGGTLSPDSELVVLASRTNSIDDRIDLTSRALEEFQSSPAIGIGFSQFTERNGPTVIHNTALWIATEFGMVGFVVFAGFVATNLVWAWRAQRVLPERSDEMLAFGVFLAMTAMLIVSFGIEALYQRTWWLLFALVGSMHAFIMEASAQLKPSTKLRRPAQRAK